METISAILRLITPNCYMAKIDIKDAYYSIHISECDQKYLKFKFAGTLYKFTCLTNGLVLGPRTFTKLLMPPLSVLRKKGTTVAAYIDDLIAIARSISGCLTDIKNCINLLDSLGLVVP